MTRYEFIKDVVVNNNFKLGAELGVRRGDTTCYLLEEIHDLRMIAVDTWRVPRLNEISEITVTMSNSHKLSGIGDINQQTQDEKDDIVEHTYNCNENYYTQRLKWKKEHEENYRIFSNRVNNHRDRVNIYRTQTHKAAKYIQDGSLDFVFIDADHTYFNCKRDILCWLPKIKSTGVMLGHDSSWPGVNRAVTEIFKKHTVHPDDVWLVRL